MPKRAITLSFLSYWYITFESTIFIGGILQTGLKKNVLPVNYVDVHNNNYSSFKTAKKTKKISDNNKLH